MLWGQNTFECHLLRQFRDCTKCHQLLSHAVNALMLQILIYNVTFGCLPTSYLRNCDKTCMVCIGSSCWRHAKTDNTFGIMKFIQKWFQVYRRLHGVALDCQAQSAAILNLSNRITFLNFSLLQIAAVFSYYVAGLWF